MWTATATINDNIYVVYHISNIGENDEIGIDYLVAKSGGREPVEKKEPNKDKKIEDIEVIYKIG